MIPYLSFNGEVQEKGDDSLAALRSKVNRCPGKGGGGRSSNDQRSDAKNPNSQEHKDAVDNRSNQIRESKESEEDEE